MKATKSMLSSPASSSSRLSRLSSRPSSLSGRAQTSPKFSPNVEPVKAIAFPEGDGYLLVKVLKDGTDQGDMQFVQSRKSSRTLAVRKWYHQGRSGRGATFYKDLPSEVRFSNLHAFPRLPFFGNLVAWQDHRSLYGNGACALVFEPINGGNMRNFIDQHWERNRRIPESFIWHYIDQIGQALGYMHLGWVEGGTRPSQWASIAHCDVEAVNIMLQYDYDKDSEAAALPQLKLIDFGYAMQYDDTEWQNRLGRIITDPFRRPPLCIDLRGYAIVICYMVWGKLPGPPSRSTVQAYWPHDVYSRRLMEILGYLVDERGFQSFNAGATKKIVEKIIPLARKKVAELRQSRELHSVDWTKPADVVNVPLDINVDSDDVKETLAALKGPRDLVVMYPEPNKKTWKFGGLHFTVLDAP